MQVDLTSHYHGQQRAAECLTLVPYQIPRGNLAVYFRETNVLVPIDQYAKGNHTYQQIHPRPDLPTQLFVLDRLHIIPSSVILTYCRVRTTDATGQMVILQTTENRSILNSINHAHGNASTLDDTTLDDTTPDDTTPDDTTLDDTLMLTASSEKPH
jgi:hypothetical protein